ncbi:DMT family transporter [Kordia sp. YSTF-M3]|uniref:DMT family transporter n=1 Tax=Kordia aestuariivivens TaxID=2759037 RepID=A0ABR7Q6Y7_9FLAO|nr:DMT family transporter [Kordia aestuariivivens]MBC8754329.1 DMT family transporter [Kordia aestuariivivens]
MLKKAIQFMIISAIAFAFLNAIVKYLGDFNAYQVVFFRSIGTLVFTIPFLLKHKISIYGNKKTLLIFRGIVGVTSMSLFFMSLKYLPMGSVVSLRYISPIFAAVFAVFFLKEKIKHIQWLFFLIAFCGVLVLKGFDAKIGTIGLLLAIASAFFSGLVFIVIRKIGDRDHPVVIVNYFMMVAVLVGGILCIPYWKTPIGWEWALLLSLGIFGYIGQLYMTKALQLAETNKAAPLKYIEVIFTMLIGLSWFHESYTVWSVLGIILIIIGLTLNTYTKAAK